MRERAREDEHVGPGLLEGEEVAPKAPVCRRDEERQPLALDRHDRRLLPSGFEEPLPGRALPFTTKRERPFHHLRKPTKRLLPSGDAPPTGKAQRQERATGETSPARRSLSETVSAVRCLRAPRII